MTNEFGDRLERQYVNNHSSVQIRSRRAVRRVNTNMDEFVTDNTDLSDVDFTNMSMRHEECFG